MTDKDETPGGEQDDISFLRTVVFEACVYWVVQIKNDIVALTCFSSSSTKDGGTTESARLCMATEGFGKEDQIEG